MYIFNALSLYLQHWLVSYYEVIIKTQLFNFIRERFANLSEVALRK